MSSDDPLWAATVPAPPDEDTPSDTPPVPPRAERGAGARASGDAPGGEGQPDADAADEPEELLITTVSDEHVRTAKALADPLVDPAAAAENPRVAEPDRAAVPPDVDTDRTAIAPTAPPTDADADRTTVADADRTAVAATVAPPSDLERTTVAPATAVDPHPTPVGDVFVVPGETRSRPRVLRRVVLGLLLVVLLLAGYYAVSLYQVWSTGRGDQARQVDAIVVLGAAQYDGRPSPQLQARLDHVLRLWPEGHAPLVVATGGRQPGDRFTEAGSSTIYLIDHGVPPEAILQEDAGTSTYESLERVASMLEERGLSRVLIVTDPYHALRSRLIAEELGLEAYVSPTTTSVVTGRASLRRHLQEAAGVALGRVVGFDRLSGRSG